MIVFKILLIILLAILGLLLLILILPLSVKLSYIDKKIDFHIKYAWIPLNFLTNKKQKPKKKKHKNIKTKTESLPDELDENEIENSSNEDRGDAIVEKDIPKKKIIKKKDKKKKAKKTFLEDKPNFLENVQKKLEMLDDIWQNGKKPLKRLCKGIHFEKLFINFKISDFDAYDCALKYGRICMVLYNSLAIMDKIFSVTKKSIDVKCVFGEENSKYDVSVNIRTSLIIPVIAGLTFFIKYYFNVIRKNKK